MFTLILVAIVLLIPALAFARSLALGDSLALGFGHASHLPTRAIVGILSCRIARTVPSEHFDFVLVNAGANDEPGRCIEKLRAKLDASVVEWIPPISPSARVHA